MGGACGLTPAVDEKLARGKRAVAGDDDDVPQRLDVALEADGVHGDAREHRAVGAVEGAEELRAGALDGADDVRDDEAAGIQVRTRQLQEFTGREMEGTESE